VAILFVLLASLRIIIPWFKISIGFGIGQWFLVSIHQAMVFGINIVNIAMYIGNISIQSRHRRKLYLTSYHVP